METGLVHYDAAKRELALASSIDEVKTQENVMKQTTRCQEYREGRISRRRNYKCRDCDIPFQVDAVVSLPERLRVCPVCNKRRKEQEDE